MVLFKWAILFAPMRQCEGVISKHKNESDNATLKLKVINDKKFGNDQKNNGMFPTFKADD